MIFIWIFFYGIIYIISNYLSGLIGINNIITAPILLIYLIIFLIWIEKINLKIGIKIPLIKLNQLFIFTPLVLFIIFNLCFFDFKFEIFTIILIISVCAFEEIFFRGILFHLLKNKIKNIAPYICSLIFAIFHCVNFIGTNNYIFVLLQIFCAFCVGVYYCGLVLKFDSLLPSYLSHLFVNITAIGILININNVYYMWLLVVSVLNLIVGVYLINKQKKKS